MHYKTEKLHQSLLARWNHIMAGGIIKSNLSCMNHCTANSNCLSLQSHQDIFCLPCTDATFYPYMCELLQDFLCFCNVEVLRHSDYGACMVHSCGIPLSTAVVHLCHQPRLQQVNSICTKYTTALNKLPVNMTLWFCVVQQRKCLACYCSLVAGSTQSQAIS